MDLEIVPQALPQENISYSTVNILNTYLSKFKHVYAKSRQMLVEILFTVTLK